MVVWCGGENLFQCSALAKAEQYKCIEQVSEGKPVHYSWFQAHTTTTTRVGYNFDFVGTRGIFFDISPKIVVYRTINATKLR